MSAEHVRFAAVTKSYAPGSRAVEAFDLSIARGELVTLIGPSGCGKSTVLNLLAGFEKPTTGHIFIDGKVADDLSPKQRDVAMVFQSYALYPHLDVRRNIAFPLTVAKVPAAESDRRVRETAERLGLTELLARRPAQLSGGQRQRVALARALVRKPQLCLFDEPLSNLDVALRAQLRAEIKQLHQEFGATFVYVTHDQAEAMTLSDRVVVLREGRAEQVGRPTEVYERPATTFVASFMGAPPMNVLDATDALGVDVPRGGSIGVRPEDLRITPVPTPDARAARVWLVEPTGAEAWVTVELFGTRLVGRAGPGFRARTGDTAFVHIDASRLHRFDAAGRRLNCRDDRRS
jgi:multiple sugar transport system ATP-binding protein